jgi:hypothetical protein
VAENSTPDDLTRWEYRTMSRKTEEYLVDDLNEAGMEGWELVTIEYRRDPSGMGDSMCWTAFIKRPYTGERPVQLAHTRVHEDEVAKKQQFATSQLDDGEIEFKFQDEAPAPTPVETGATLESFGDELQLGDELKIQDDDESELKLEDDVAEAEIVEAEELVEDEEEGQKPSD